MTTRLATWFIGVVLIAGSGDAQVTPAPQAQVTSAPLTLTLKDALARAAANAPQVLAAVADAAVAHQDLIQARAARLPSASFTSDYLGTQGNGVLPHGRFVTNNGVHVYRDWGVVHQDFTAAFTGTAAQRAAATEAFARARADIARRGLVVTLTRGYYGLLSAQRKYATAQEALDQARRYRDLSQSLQRGGEVARSDVVRADLQYTTQEQVLREAKLTMDTARLDLAVLLFATSTRTLR